MRGLSIFDDDNGVEVTKSQGSKRAFEHADFQGWRDNADWTIKKCA